MSSVEAQLNASERCPILRLPAELRLNIYRYALVEIGPSRVQLRDLEVPALLQSCRKIYLEASPVYFSENQFVLTVNIPPIAFYPKPLHSRVHRVVIPSWIKSLEEVAPVQMRNVKVEIDLAYKLGVITMGGDGSGDGRAGRLRVVEAWIHNGRQKLPLGSMREAVSAYLDYTVNQKLEVDEDRAGLNYREVVLIASKMLRQWAGTIVPA